MWCLPYRQGMSAETMCEHSTSDPYKSRDVAHRASVVPYAVQGPMLWTRLRTASYKVLCGGMGLSLFVER